MPELPELREVLVTVARIPCTELVHLDVAGAGGLVMSRDQARALARDLLRQAARNRRSAARRAERGSGRPAAAAH